MVIRSTISIVCASIAGIAYASFFFVPLHFILVAVGFVSVTGVVLYFQHVPENIVIIVISILFFFGGVFRYESVARKWDASLPQDFYGSMRIVQGTVLSSARSERSQKIFLKTNNSGTILVTTALHPAYSYGDRVVVSGKVDDPLVQYPRRESLWVRGASSMMYFPQVVSDDPHFQRNWMSVLFSFREELEDKLKELYAEPYNALADGMLFGSTNGIDKNIYDVFRRSGTSHILVLSGFNISVVAIFLLFVLQFIFRRRYAIVGAMIGVILFTIMTGLGSPAVRAAIMALIGLLGFYTGRQYRADIALMWAIFFMLFSNPLLLRWDAGFQLSVAATLGIMYIAPFVERLSMRIVPVKSFGSMIATTIGAQVGVLPFFVWWGVNISPWSIVANMFVVPVVPFIMAFSAGAILLSFMSIPIALLIAFPAFLLMKWQIVVASYFGA